ncbi:MAG: 7TM receptor with intracellular metal dependent phosphohydrolase [Atribacteria bacterium 34_868]|nr:MAG: 7TM receptor with intracellular metal dependent phosphohydrolase [Atribacteria bacterium 34_868]
MNINKINRKNIKILQKNTLQRIAIFFLLIILVTFILSINFIPSKIILKVGEVAPRDIVSPKTIEFVDEKATEKLREEAAKSIREVYHLNLASIENVEKELTNFFSDIKELRNKYHFDENQIKNNQETKQLIIDPSINDDLEMIKEKYSINLESTIMLNLVTLDQFSLKEIEQNVNQAVKKIMQQGVRENDMEEAKKQILREISELASNPYTAVLAGEIGTVFLKPSLFLDEEATQLKKQEAIAAVKEVKNVIRKDQIIIRKGEIVTPEHIEKLEALGLQNPVMNFQNILGLLILNSILIFLLALYIFTYHKTVYHETNKLILLGVLYLTIIFIAKVIGEVSAYLIPVAFVSMLIAITIDSRLAIWMTFLISFNIGIIFFGEIDYMIVALAGGLISIFSIRKATQRSSLTRAGLFIALVNIFSITALGLIHGHSTDIILKNNLLGLLNGFISAILTIGILPFLESFFDISSSFRLMELSNPNQPLLRQLLVEAPGTYHHSVIVGNLAEAAAEEIGANSLLARVGARKYKLPKSIIDIINQHHGTGIISYFYHKALQTSSNKSTEVNEENYRYSGPKPQTKEAGIILLADMLEAEARTLNSPTSSRIKSLTQNVITRNLENGQLDECNLTLRELNKIKEVFSKILTGMFHNRVEYPDDDLINKLKKERSQSENTDKKQPETDNKSSEIKKSTAESNGTDETKRNK